MRPTPEPRRRHAPPGPDRVAAAAARVWLSFAVCAALSSGCASTREAPTPRRVAQQAQGGAGGLRPDAKPERERQVRVLPDGTCEYMADIYTDVRRLGRRLEKDSVSGKGRSRKMRPVVLAARGQVPMRRLEELRDQLNDLGLPSVVIKSSTISTVTVETAK